jgi:hypothetical protein
MIAMGFTPNSLTFSLLHLPPVTTVTMIMWHVENPLISPPQLTLGKP